MKKLIFAILIISALACRKEIPLYDNNNFEPQLVINAALSPKEKIKVYVSLSTKPESLDSTKFITGAEVKLWQNGNLISTLSLIDSYRYSDSLPYYTCNNTLQENQTYRLSVKYLDKEAYADFYIPAAENNFSCNITEITLFDTNHYFFKDTLNFSLEATAKIEINSAADTVYFVPALYTDNISVYFVQDTIPHFVKNKYFADLYFSTEFASFKFPTCEIPNTGTAYFYPAQSFMINPAMFQGHISISPSFFITGVTFDSTGVNLYFRNYSFSQDLYNYYESYFKAMRANDNPFVEPVNVFTNVKNGYGIVAGYNFVQDSIFIPFEGNITAGNYTIY